MTDERILPDAILPDRPSGGSLDELGLLIEIAALFDELPFREVWPLSESSCCGNITKFLSQYLTAINYIQMSKKQQNVR